MIIIYDNGIYIYIHVMCILVYLHTYTKVVFIAFSVDLWPWRMVLWKCIVHPRDSTPVSWIAHNAATTSPTKNRATSSNGSIVLSVQREKNTVEEISSKKTVLNKSRNITPCFAVLILAKCNALSVWQWDRPLVPWHHLDIAMDISFDGGFHSRS